MKWILVWWVIHPGHAQLIHQVRDLDSEAACHNLEAMLPANTRRHCSVQ